MHVITCIHHVHVGLEVFMFDQENLTMTDSYILPAFDISTPQPFFQMPSVVISNQSDPKGIGRDFYYTLKDGIVNSIAPEYSTTLVVVKTVLK